MADPMRIVKLIEWELDNNCDIRVYPEVCHRRKSARHRESIIIAAINLIGKEGFDIPSAIAQIEMELQNAKGS
jgi:hypothetical protein